MTLDWQEVAELNGIKLRRHPELDLLARKARTIKFRMLMRKLIDAGWPDADTGNDSAWWESGTDELHLFACDDLGFRIHAFGFQPNFAEAKTVADAAAVLIKIRGGRDLRAALKTTFRSEYE